MFQSLQGFDPLYYFNVDTSKLTSEQKNKVRKILLDKLGEYILLKISASLSPTQQKEVSQLNEKMLVSKLSSYMPDLENRILEEIEAYKKEYEKALRKQSL